MVLLKISVPQVYQEDGCSIIMMKMIIVTPIIMTVVESVMEMRLFKRIGMIMTEMD